MIHLRRIGFDLFNMLDNAMIGFSLFFSQALQLIGKFRYKLFVLIIMNILMDMEHASFSFEQLHGERPSFA